MLRFRMAVLVGLALGLGVVGFGSSALLQAGEAGQQQGETVELKIKTGYQLFLPSAYGKDPSAKWPLIIFLHGSGERGTDLQKVKVHGPPKLVANVKDYPYSVNNDFPFVVLSPQCPDEQVWSPLVLSTLLDEIEAKYAIDQDRIYLTGLSLGGFGTWNWAMAQPHRFAALVPICGKGEVRGAKKIKHIPTWVFHGAKDQGVPVIHATEMIDALEKAGGKPKLTIYPDLGHDSWTITYANPELYKWLLEQKRASVSDKAAK